MTETEREKETESQATHQWQLRNPGKIACCIWLPVGFASPHLCLPGIRGSLGAPQESLRWPDGILCGARNRT